MVLLVQVPLQSKNYQRIIHAHHTNKQESKQIDNKIESLIRILFSLLANLIVHSNLPITSALGNSNILEIIALSMQSSTNWKSISKKRLGELILF